MTFFNNNENQNQSREQNPNEKYNFVLPPYARMKDMQRGDYQEPEVDRPIDYAATLAAIDDMHQYINNDLPKCGPNYVLQFNNEYENFIKAICDAVAKVFMTTDPRDSSKLQTNGFDFSYTCLNIAPPMSIPQYNHNGYVSVPTEQQLISAFRASRLAGIINKLEIDPKLVRVSAAANMDDFKSTVVISFKFYVYPVSSNLHLLRKELELGYREATINQTLNNINHKILPMLEKIFDAAGSIGQIETVLKEVDTIHDKVQELLSVKEAPKPARRKPGPKKDTSKVEPKADNNPAEDSKPE